MSLVLVFLVVASSLGPGGAARKEFLGCHEDNYMISPKTLTDIYTEDDCVNACFNQYFPFALFRTNTNCGCSHYYGDFRNDSQCEKYCPDCDAKNQLRDVYSTGFKVLGPPTNLVIGNITDTQLHISWRAPEYSKSLLGYTVRAKVLRSYSSVPIQDMSWNFSNDTFDNDLSSLHPGTHYNITVKAKAKVGWGAEAYQIIETRIGLPSNVPEMPEIISRNKTRMKIVMKPVVNDNGPVTSYLIVVSNRSSIQEIDYDNLMSLSHAQNKGLSYYITAEVPPERLNGSFEIGDERVYGSYYNAALSPSTTYDVLLGVKSKKDNIETRLFSPLTVPTIIHRVKEETYNTQYLLYVLISLVCTAIIVVPMIFVAVKFQLGNPYRRQMNDTQELRVRTSTINVENHGYVAEEQPARVNHYEELRKQVWMIPHQSLKVDYIHVLGQGKFGYIYKATLEKETAVDVLVYSIADRTLTHDQKQEMLKDLGLLIKAGKHRNVLEFLGTCENLDSICVTMEFNNLSLKEYLLACRIKSGRTYTTLDNRKVLYVSVCISDGLRYLHSRKIIHKQICAHHIALFDPYTPKIMGFGLCCYYKDGRSINCARWTAREVLNGGRHSTKSDVWSMACLIWEICALGGTPYVSITTGEISERVIRGCILPQLDCMDPEFYQALLNCWQISTDERPSIILLQQTMEFYLNDAARNYIDFSQKEDDDKFQYEQYDPELELNSPMA